MFYNTYSPFRFANPDNYTTFAGVNSKDMKKTMLLLALCAMFVGCEDSIEDHQPLNPKTWSPVGHSYESIDESDYGRYLGKEIIFTHKDTCLMGKQPNMQIGTYRIEYPLIYFADSTTPWLKFLDTLTITKAYEMADESSCYILVK